MKIRLTFIILAILSTIGLVLVLAKYPTGPHTINYNEPYTVLIAITTIVIMALPALILGIFNHLTCRIISAILQISALMMWGFLVIIILIMGQIVIILMASLTILALLVSSIVTLSVHPSTSDKIN